MKLDLEEASEMTTALPTQNESVYRRPSPEIPTGQKSEPMLFMTKLFHGLANPTRISILLLLARRGEENVDGLVRELGVLQPRVSDHLRVLAGCGYVRARRQGRNAFYSVADGRVIEMLELGEELKTARRASKYHTKEGE